MAVPKKGLDYFPLFCTLDDKFKFVEAAFGIKGFAIVIKLYQKIYGQEGYYCDWSQDVALLFTDELRLSGNVVNEVVNECLKRGIFNQEKYDQFGILTSAGIQKQYLRMTSRRLDSKISDEYSLLTVRNKPPNVDIMADYADIMGENVSNEEQSKVKESKGNNINKINNMESLFELYETEFKRPLSQNEAQRLSDWYYEYPYDEIVESLRQASIRSKFSFDYINKILINRKKETEDEL